MNRMLNAPHIRPVSFCALLGLASVASWAGPKFNFNEGKSSLEITQTLQLWGAITPSEDNTPATDPRIDLYLKRGRFGFKGQAMPGLYYTTNFAYDNVGKDPYGGTSTGSGQDLTNGRFVVMDAFLSYEIDTSLAVVTLGYVRPQTSREFTSAFGSVSSLDFSLVYAYYREHLTVRSSGRETGVNVGGQWAMPGKFGIQYNIGGFDAVQEKAKTNANLRGHRTWSPLWTGRVALTAGDMENSRYAMKQPTQYFGKRTGLTLGAYGSYQGETDKLYDTTAQTSTTPMKLTYAGGFSKNLSYGSDFLANWKGLSVSGELSFLQRDTGAGSYTDTVWYARAAYGFKLGDSLGNLEPVLLYSRFTGDANSVPNPKGEETQMDMGVNWFPPVKGVRISAHYIYADGEAKSQYSKGANKAGVQDTKNSSVVGELLVQF